MQPARAVHAAAEHCAHVRLVQRAVRRVVHEAVLTRQPVRRGLPDPTKECTSEALYSYNYKFFSESQLSH